MSLTKFLDTEVSATEEYMREKVATNKNMMVPYYLMCAWAYYVEDNPIASDSFFDQLAKDILASYDEITHRHKRRLKKEILEAGTFIGKYPPMMEGAVKSLRGSVNL